MKLWQCDWVPSSVADWLCRELDERGIPGSTYTYTLLSLLHPYFCPHPVPKETAHLPKDFINFDCVSSVLKSGQLQELEFLFEELEDHVHPDADFPELKIFDQLKEGNHRSKRRQKRKLQKLSRCPEKAWKASALQYLLTAADEPKKLESVIEELFDRLKSSTKGFTEETKTNFSGESTEGKRQEHETGAADSARSDITDSCYSSNFPPLLTTKLNDKENIASTEESTLNWKSLIKNKLSPEKKRIHSEGCNKSSSIDEQCIANDCPDQTKSFSVEEAKDMEINPISLEFGSMDKNPFCFIPICDKHEEEFISEGAADGPKNEGFNGADPPVSEKETAGGKEGTKLEEWECAGGLLPCSTHRAVSVDVLGNRLFERSHGSADTTRCNSNTDLRTGNVHSVQDDDIKLFDPGDACCDARGEAPTAPVWDFPSTSWKVHNMQDVWDQPALISSQNYAESSSTISTNPFHTLPPFNFEENQKQFQGHKEETGTSLSKNRSFEIGSLSKNRSFENWPTHQNWNSLPLIDQKFDQKLDPVFSSAFRCSPHSAFKEGTRQDRKVSIPSISSENLKNIWSDFNDNNISSGQTGSDAVQTSSIPDFSQTKCSEKTEEKLCESFRQLGLEHLWEDPLLIDNMPEDSHTATNYSSESSSVIFFDETPKSQGNQGLFTDDIYRMKCAQNKEIENNFLLHSIPSGPSGPYVDLRHTENSGFTPVIPQDRNLLLESENCGEESSHMMTPKGMIETALEHTLTAQEEENLLTSPRTHFRPIRQDSHGSGEEGKSEDGQGVVNVTANVQDPDTVFQRSGSGTLYLESDLLKGSPKKYMAYREPSAKFPTAANSNDLLDRPLIPQPSVSPSAFVPKFKLVNNEKFCQTEAPDDESGLGERVEKDLQSKFLGSEGNKYGFTYQQSKEIWNGKYPNKIKMLWDEDPAPLNKEAWELGPSDPDLSYPKWSSKDLNKATWSNDTIQPPIQNHSKDNPFFNLPEQNLLKSEDDNFSKIKFIWHNSTKEKSKPLPIGSSAPMAVNKSLDFVPSVGSFADSWDNMKQQDKGFHPIEPSLGTSFSGLQPGEPPLVSSLIIPKNPWNDEIGLQKDKHSFKSLTEDHTSDTDLASRWQLQWEVDQEADEILGGLLPSSPLKASPPYDGAFANPEREELNFLDFLGDQDQLPHPIEDLDHLEPGWDLNEGFEWGPASENLFDGDDDIESTQEVLLYENEAGQTVMLPVEYLEDSLYDQIFGSADTPIGGSLPDLPGGQMNELKKGSLSYKFSRRSRGDKFVPPSRRPCSFFLEGNCRRNDCKFSHDLLTITCRFWEEDSCLKGDTCPFRHGFPPSRRRNRSEGDQAFVPEPVSLASLKERGGSKGSKGRAIPRKVRNSSSVSVASSFEIDSEADFPCLGSSLESKVGSLDEQSFPQNIKVAKLSKKKKKYISVTKALFKEFDKGKEGFPGGASGSRREDEGGGAPTHFRKKKEKRDRGECDSLRKVLRKRQLPTVVGPKPPHPHEDGTLSDF